MNKPNQSAARSDQRLAALILGASAGLGRSLAYGCAQLGYNLVLCARDLRDLEAIRSDIALRHGVDVSVVAVDLADLGSDLLAVVAAAGSAGPLKAVMAPVGASHADDVVGAESDLVKALVHTNLVSVMRAVNAIIPLLDCKHHPVIIGFGSIAATRGRSKNPVYSAAKRGLQTYFEGLRHALHKRGIRVQFIVLGYMETALSRGAPLKLPKVTPDWAARRIIAGLDRDRGTFYLPAWWALVCFALQRVPWFLFKRIDF